MNNNWIPPLEKLHGKLITKGDFEYEEERRMWNRANQKYPLAILFCKNEEEIQNAVRWTNSYKVPFCIRSGRHHYEGFSAENDALIIDISLLNDIQVDEECKKVTIGGGVRNRELYEELGNRGYPFPGGGCPTVGVAAFTLNGGWGYSSRLLGLACDSLIEVRMIDANGEVIIASEKSHQDLFWALRGAGAGNFGVVTSLTFKLPQKIEKATYIRLEYFNLTNHESLDLFKVWQEELANLDRRMNLKLSFYNSAVKGKGALLTGIFYGEVVECHKILERFKCIGTKLDLEMSYLPVVEVNRIIQDSHPDYEKYKSTGRFVEHSFNEEEMKTLLDLVITREEGAVYAALSFYGLGGSVSDIPQAHTAFYYRKAKCIMGLQTVWEEDRYAPSNRRWLVERFKVMEQMTEGSFVSFPLKELENYEEAYYGDGYLRLREIKGIYDPQNIFNFPQVIRR